MAKPLNYAKWDALDSDGSDDEKNLAAAAAKEVFKTLSDPSSSENQTDFPKHSLAAAADIPRPPPREICYGDSPVLGDGEWQYYKGACEGSEVCRYGRKFNYLSRTNLPWQFWPRLPSSMGGKFLPPGTSLLGTLTPSRHPWAEAAYDFYWIHRYPDQDGSPLSHSITYIQRSACLGLGEGLVGPADDDSAEHELLSLLPWNVVRRVIFDQEDEDGKKEGYPYSIVVDHLKISLVRGYFVQPLTRYDIEKDESVQPFQTFVPKLEEKLEEEAIPDILMVHDPDDLLSRSHVTASSSTALSEDSDISSKFEAPDVLERACKPKPDRVFKYRRETPNQTSTEDKHEPTTGHLYLSSQHRIGIGHHADVWKAEFSLPRPFFGISSSGRVSVAAKVCDPKEKESVDFLEHEAKAYAKFPAHFFEEYNGVYLVFPIKNPIRPAAVVPRVYGYYKPDVSHGDESLSPILLMEECGSPVGPWTSAQDVDACAALHFRIRDKKMMQGSVYRRNMLVQPGPLHAHPAERCMHWPSYRIIDFGRFIDGNIPEDWKKWEEAQFTALNQYKCCREPFDFGGPLAV